MWIGGRMTINELCDLIELQKGVKERVLAFSARFDFSIVEKLLKDFRDYKKIKSARLNLQEILGEDEDGIKILACMLKASANLYDVYKVKGISDEVYVETMKCYTRFINETYRMTGRYYFDRQWWTAREAGGHLYRIGELEYELKRLEGQQVIDIHIPSDANFSPKAVDESLEMAEEFLRIHYPEMSDCDFTCDSWLLSRQLEGMLKEESNIRSFAKRFEILGEGEPDTEFVEWIFNTKTDNYETLPENTSLQRGMKKFILSGGLFRNGYGILKSKQE